MVWLKRFGYGIGTLGALIALAVGCIYALSEYRFSRTHVVAEELIASTNDSAAIARGEHIANAVAGCADCHGPGLGGNVMFDASPMGRLVALNLTKGDGGVGALLTPALIERAVRHG